MGRTSVWSGARVLVHVRQRIKGGFGGELQKPGFPWWLSGKESACNAGDPGSIPGSGRSPGGGNGNPLQYSCLENPMDREAWRATMYGVTKSQDRATNTSLVKTEEQPPPHKDQDRRWRWGRDWTRTHQAFGSLSEHFLVLKDSKATAAHDLRDTRRSFPRTATDHCPFLPRSLELHQLLRSVSPDCALRVSGTCTEPSRGPGWPESMVTELGHMGMSWQGPAAHFRKSFQ